MRSIRKRFVAFLFAIPRLALAHASSKTVDTIDERLATFVIAIVPIAALAVMLMIHVLLKKIAGRHHHPQNDAILTPCFLSLMFGRLPKASRVAMGIREAARLAHRNACSPPSVSWTGRRFR